MACPEKYYELWFEDNANHWFIAPEGKFQDGTDLDLKNIWNYSRCNRLIDPLPVPFVITKKGTRIDINFNSFISPVVSQRIGDVIEEIAGNTIQRIPANVVGDEGNWEVINILTEADCIDYEKSILTYYPANHSIKPNKLRSMKKLVFRSSQLVGKHWFRLKDTKAFIYLSETMKTALENASATGLEVREIETSDD